MKALGKYRFLFYLCFMNRNKVVYFHRRKTDNSIFYIGCGNLIRAYSKNRRENWHETVKECGYIVEIYKDGLTAEDAFELEEKLITEYGRLDFGTGLLINQTSGGRVVKGFSDIVKEKKSKSLKAVIRTVEWKKKISAAHVGRIKSEEWRANLAKAATGKKTPESVREKMRASNKSKIITARPILCYDFYTDEVVGEFSSLRDAGINLGCLDTSISNNLHYRTEKVYSKILNKKLKFKYICAPSENFYVVKTLTKKQRLDQV